MAGQSANLTLKEARAMQERTQCGENAQGPKKSGAGNANPEILTKKGK